jgi:rhamnosyltransferase
LKIGPYREDYFIDFVDYEYCLRGKSCRMILSQIHSVILKHSPGVRKTGHCLGIKYIYCSSAPMRYYYVIRNGLATALVYKNIWCISIVIKVVAKVLLLEDKKNKKINFILKGAADFFKSKYGELL